MQITIPHNVGNTKLRAVHLIEAVSFFIVSNVVVQGKCNTVKIMTFTAVNIFQLFCNKICPIDE